MTDQPQPQADEQRLAELNAQLVAKFAAEIDSWEVVLDGIDGWVVAAMRHGWPERMARQLVLVQFEASMRQGRG